MAIIGSGAGLMVMEAALAKGMKCALIEKSKIGGTCLTKGCIPSKMLVYPADMIRETQTTSRIGLEFCEPVIDWETIAKRMWQQINFSDKIKANLISTENLTVFGGTGEFTSPGTMKVKYDDGTYSEEFTAERFIVAAGARSFIPQINGLDETGFITSETFFGEKFPDKPWESLAIIGGGAIGVEFAHIFSAFGTRVTLVETKPHIISTEEEEISDFVEKRFKENDVEIITGGRIVSVNKSGDKKILLVENFKGRKTVSVDEIFISSGIQSNGDLLQLDHAKIETDSRGWIVTNNYLESSQKNIWALGDINGKFQFRHKANYEAGILINNLFGDGEKKQANYGMVPWAIFTWPQVAHVGLTEKEATERGYKVFIGRNFYSDVAGGIAMGFRHGAGDNGFVKIIAAEDKKIIGVHIVGPNAAILVQPFVYLMISGYQCKCTQIKEKLDKSEHQYNTKEVCPQIGTYLPIADSMVIHPSLSELTAWAIDNIDWN